MRIGNYMLFIHFSCLLMFQAGATVKVNENASQV